MNKREVALRLQDVHASLAGKEVLRGIDISFQLGRWTSIVGPNGAGKSTLLKAMAGLVPTSGKIFLLDQELRMMGPKHRAQQLSWLGQNETVSDDLCVWDVVMLGRIPHQEWLAPPNVNDHQVVKTVLQATQAWQLRERSLGQLSGGERQRVLLARAMAVRAQIMLMDEPTANLDPPHQVAVVRLLQRLAAAGTLVVSVLHDLPLALQAERLLVLQGGRVHADASSASTEAHAALVEVFGGAVSIERVNGRLTTVPVL